MFFVRKLIWIALRKYKLSNMSDGDDQPYPLVDLMSNDGTTIETGMDEILVLADHICGELCLTEDQWRAVKPMTDDTAEWLTAVGLMK